MPATTTPGVRLGRFLGARVVLTWSWFLFVAAIVPLYATRLTALGQSTTTAVLVGVAIAFVWGGSVLLHEFGHVIAGRLLGCRVHSVQLGFLGGETAVEPNRADAREEFWVAASGPLVSFALGLPSLVGLLTGSGLSLGISGVAGLVIASVGLANLAITAFNLLPGLPLDGGRMALAAIWKATGNQQLARRITALIGQLIAVGLVATTVVLILTRRDEIGPSLPLVLALLILAASLWSMAGRYRRSAELEARLAAQPVADAMRQADWVASDTPVGTALAVTSQPVILVHDPVSSRTGVVGRDRLMAAADSGRSALASGGLAANLPDSQVIGERASRLDLIQRLRRTPHPWFVVVSDDGLPLGIVAVDAVPDASPAPTTQRPEDS